MIGEKSAIPDDILIETTTSALEALASLLTSVLSQDVYGSSTVEILDALATLLSRLLTTVFPLLSKPKSKRSKKARLERGLAIDNMLGLLSTTILVPLIPSFARLSVQYLSALFSDNKTSKHAQSHAVIDIRPIVFAFVDKTISVLDELVTSGGAFSINSHRHVKCLLALQSIRELAKLYPESSRGTAADMNLGETTAAGVQPPHPQPPNRLVRLAKKDAAWYLCNVLHRVLPASPESLPADPSDEQAALLEDAIYTTMSALLRCTRGTAHHKAAGALPAGGVSLGHPFCGTMGEVERGMLLAVVERLWLGM
ncbi:hypothetical protein A0H81_00150 [Grifola frondosa]|uniref:Uncharacterized protein n=1 Tax=Grifola frondosa TaxID=5627 RepID=A0A1C7MQT2_GRIFR|nr:hypothetical protein A0H81_00150 [Grifola frondosa]